MSGYSEDTLNYYGRYAEVDRFEHLGQAEDEDPWWDRFYDEGDCFKDYDGYRDEVER